MFDWIIFTVNGLNWTMGTQLQQVLDDLEEPVIHIGSSGAGLTDLTQLKKGKFDPYFGSLFHDFDKLEEFVMHFLPFTRIMDYCLGLWREKILMMSNIEELELLTFSISYSPLNSLLEERISELLPEKDEDQTSLDEFF